MMRQTARLLSLSLLSATLLTACSSDDTPVAGGAAPATPAPPTTPVTVTPSLGKVFNAALEVRCAATGTTLGSGSTGASGALALALSGSCSGPVIVELLASASSTYFDEQANAVVSLPAGTQLRAVLPALPASGATLAVTPLTEIAFRQALVAAGNVESALTALQVTTANAAVAAQVFGAAASGLDILQAPTPWDASLTSGSLGNTAADRYAFLLAALAGLGGGASAPAVAVTAALAGDLADGTLNGVTSAGVSYTGANLGTLLATEYADFSAYANAALQTALGISAGGGGGGGGGGAGAFPNETITLPPTLTTLLPASELTSLVGTYTGVRGSIKESGVTTSYNSCSIVVAANGNVTVSANGQSITQTVDGGNGGASTPAINDAGSWGVGVGGAPGTNVNWVNLNIKRNKMIDGYAYIVADTSAIPTVFTKEIRCYMPINRVVTSADADWNHRPSSATASDFPTSLVGNYSGTLFSESVGGSAAATPGATCSVSIASDGTVTASSSGNPHPLSMTTKIAGDQDDQVSYTSATDWALRSKDVTEPVGNGYDSIVMQNVGGSLLATATRKAANVNVADAWSCMSVVKQAAP